MSNCFLWRSTTYYFFSGPLVRDIDDGPAPSTTAESRCQFAKKKSLTFRVSVANPQKLLYTLANPARGLLNMENKKIKEKSSRLWETFCPIA